MVAKKQVFCSWLLKGPTVGLRTQSSQVSHSAALDSPPVSPGWPAALPFFLLLLSSLWSKLTSLPQLPIRGLLTLTYNNTACWASLSDAHMAANIEGQMLEPTRRFTHKSSLPSFSQKIQLITEKEGDDTLDASEIELELKVLAAQKNPQSACEVGWLQSSRCLVPVFSES